MDRLNVTDLLLIRAAAAGELTVRESAGYDEGKPEGWPVTVWQGRVCTTDDEGRIGSLQRWGYLTDPDSGPIEVTSAGREVLR